MTDTDTKKVPKAERVQNVKHIIKHAPPRIFKFSNLLKTYYIKSSTPYISLIKHIDKKFSELEAPKNRKSKLQYITVLGMGKNVEKCLSIGLHYQDEKQHRVEILTKTVNVMDEFEIAEQEDTEYRKRAVSGVEIRIYKK